MALWQIPMLENAESLFSYRHHGQDSTIICPEYSWYCSCTQQTIKSSTHFCAAFQYLHVYSEANNVKRALFVDCQFLKVEQ